MSNKLILTNNSSTYNPNRIYKVNEIINYLGYNFQNATGRNTIPGIDVNWEEITGGGGSATIVTKTKAEIDTLILGNDLVPLTVYKITGVDTTLYGGSTIYLQAITDSTLAVDGIGKFYNPKYNQAVSGFDVWTITGTYAIGDKVHWGGKTWENVAGNVGTSTDLFTLDSEWSVISFNDTDYNVAYDSIKYDYFNDSIIYRNEQNSNIVSTSKPDTDWSWNYKPIKVFMWGNIFNSASLKGIGSQNIINSYNENINFRGSRQIYLNFNNGGYQQNINFENNSYQSYINLTDSSFQDGLNFNNGSYQNGLNLNTNSGQYDINFDNVTSQQNIIFENNSFHHNLTETTGLTQSKITFKNYQFDRTSSPMASNETGLIFQGDLPISTTATKIIVKENNQLKEKDINPQYTVATLPTGTQGDEAYVTDALTPTYLGTVIGGGAVVCKVFFNGTNWTT